MPPETLPSAPGSFTEWIWYMLFLVIGGGGLHGARTGLSRWKSRKGQAGTRLAVESGMAELQTVLESIQISLDQSNAVQREHMATVVALRIEIEKMNGASVKALDAIADRVLHNHELLIRVDAKIK